MEVQTEPGPEEAIPTQGQETEILNKVTFKAGTLQQNFGFWKSLTSNRYVLNIISGYDIELNDKFESVMKHRTSPSHHFDNATSAAITSQVDELLSMGVIEKCLHSVGEYISPVFLVDKANGEHRKILNLKKFNQCVDYRHFKMENLKSVCDLLTDGCFMTSIDLRKAYYSVSISPDSRKFLRFEWRSQLYQYCALPNGLSSGPRIFSCIMRVLFAQLRKRKIDCVYYLDDSVIMAKSRHECTLNTEFAMDILSNAGFYIHYEKSVLKPTQRLTFLGFVIDSKDMSIYLPDSKIDKLKSCVHELLSCSSVTVERLSQVIGFLVSCLPAFTYGKLHYRSLEMQKIESLRHGSYKTQVMLSPESRSDLLWWSNNADSSGNPIKPVEFSVELRTDASMQGYGAFCSDQAIGGRWTEAELSDYGHSINCLELYAVYLAIKALSSTLRGSNVCVRIDNTTAVCYINSMGGTHSVLCDKIAKMIWNTVIDMSMHIYATHIPGVDNVEADHASRFFNDDAEIMLDSKIFDSLCSDLNVKPCIDLFATRHNKQLPVFVSWKPDPDSSYVDALSLDWASFTSVYIFPPFSLWGRLLPLLQRYRTRVEMMVIYPKWPAQHWFHRLEQMVTTKVEITDSSVVTTPSRQPHRLQFTLVAGKI